MPDQPGGVMIFGAGFGTRMGALTAARPKPLIEISGRTLLDRSLEIAARAKIRPVVVNTHYLHDQMEKALRGTGAVVSHEVPDILDTGGGLRQGLRLLGQGPVFTMNPDCVWRGPNPLGVLGRAWDPKRMGALLLLVPLANAHAFDRPGDFALEPDGRLTRKGPYVYTGAQIIDPAGLADIGDRVFSLNVLWDRLAAQGRAFGHVYDGDWCDVGHPAGIAVAEALVGGADA